MRHDRRSLMLLVASSILFAAACSGSADQSSESSSIGNTTPSTIERSDGRVSDDDQVTPASETAENNEADLGPDAEPRSMQELEAQWAANREKIVGDLTSKIESGEYGLGDDGIVRGAGGFEMDINACPSNWSNTQGITGDSVRLGHTTAKSGSLAAYGNIGDGMEAYFSYVNDNGGIGGKDIVLVQQDDGYDVGQTIQLVDDLIDAENVLGVTTLGTPNSIAVYDKLNTECTPQLFVMSGHQAWGDPVLHPWTIGMQLSYATEAILWGEWIRTNLANKLPVKVAGLVMDNDFGMSYEQGMEQFAAAHPDVISEFVAVRHDPAAADLREEMTTVAAAEPNVFISMTAGKPCLLAMQEAESVGLLEVTDARFTPSVCRSVAAYLSPAGDAAEGWHIVGGGAEDMTDPSTDGDPYWDFVREELGARGFDTNISLYGSGFASYGFEYVETLRIANELPEGLNRTNLLLAARHLSLDHPGFFDGIAFATNGVADAYPVEGSDILRFDVATQEWVRSDVILDVNGSTPNCSWDATGVAGCR